MIDKRMMYAQGQRVAKTLDGSRPGYRGDDAARSSEGTSGGRADPGAGAGYGDGPSSSDRDTNTREDNSPQATGNSPPLQRAIPIDVKEQYAVGTPTTLGAPIAPPDFTKVGPGSTMDDNRIKALNLAGSTYKPFNIPPFIPGSTLINTAGNFLGNLGYKKNTQFFADNVAGKYGYGYGEDAYKDYMKKRMAGQVNAYGRPLTEGELRLRDGDGGGDNGIMDVYNNPNEPDDGDADGDGDSDQDDFIFRYFDETGETLQAGAGGVEDLMTQIRKRISNIFS